MKMKNLVAYAMLALGAVAAPFAALSGDIAEIRPWLDTRVDVNEELKAGQSLKFVVRLASRSIEEPAQWSPVYQGIGSTILPQLYMPKMGLVLSGKLRYAELTSWGPNVQKGEVFTDLIFEYVVQPGDFAQPALLALKESTEQRPVFADSTRGGGEQSYFLKNVVGYDPAGTMFKFCDKNGNECAFSYMALNDERMNKLSSKWPEGVQNLDIDLAGGLNHYMLKSIDFDDKTEVDQEDGVTYWRVVKEGDTQTLAFNPRIETIGIYGTNAVQIGSAPRYYVWSDDEAAVTLEKAKGAKKMTLRVPNASGSGYTLQDRWVYTFDLVTGQQGYEFAVYGVEQGKKANLVLSGASDYAYNTAGTVVTNFLVSPLAVKCGAKPPPSIRLTWQETGKAGLYPENGQPAVCTYTNDISEIAEQGKQIAVEVRNGTFSEPVTLVLKARVAGDESGDWDYVYTNSLIGTAVCEPGDLPDTFAVPPRQTEVKFTPNGSLTKNVFVYPVGSAAKFGTKGQNIEFALEWGEGTPQAIKDEFTIDGICTLRTVDAKPAVVSPAEGEVFQIEESISVVVMDSYRDLTAPRKFVTQVRAGTRDLYVATNAYSSAGPTEILLNRAKVLDILKQRLGEEYLADIQVRVTDPLGQVGTSAIFKLVIPAKPEDPVIPTVRAVLYDTTSEDSLHPSADFREGDAPIVRFILSAPLPVDTTGANNRYAFLVPRVGTRADLVKYAGLENGVLIAAGETNSVLSLGAQMKLLDGCADTDMSQNRQMSFDIVLKTPSGVEDTTYQPDPNGLQFTVQNVKPVSQALYVNGNPDPTPDGGRFPFEVSSGIDQTFMASYEEAYDWPDVKNVDLTNGIVTIWCFTDGKNSNSYKYSAVTSKTDTATCLHTFTYAGGADQQVRWIPVDKDMLKQLLGDAPLTAAGLQSLWPSLLKIATPYTVTVHVGDAPHIVLGREETFVWEDSKTDKVQIMLSEAYDGGKLYLKVKLTPLDEYAENPGHASFQAEVLEIEGGLEPKKTTKYNNGLKFDYEELDGTAVSSGDGFFLEVEAYEDEDCTIPVARYAKAEGYVYVDNVPPVITPREPWNLTTNKTLSVNEEFTLQWSVSDVKRDLAEGLTCKWYIDDNLQNSLTKVVTDENQHETALRFTSDGFHEVRLEVEDKDGEDAYGKATRRWLYYISPTKTLEVKALGPSPMTKTKYGTVAGLGLGRVWANGIKGVSEDFSQTWTYSVKAAEAEVHAYGYASSNTVYRDDGTLGGKNRDLAIDASGNSFPGEISADDCYLVDGRYDSFFYRWAFVVADEGGGASTISYSALQPMTKSETDVSETVALDPFEDNKDSYAKRRVEAVFSREFLATDNLGDINQDGVPDIAVLKYGFGVVSESGEVSGDDLKKQSGFNEDGDYIPSTETSQYSSLIPQLPESWAEFGTPFNARMELRGYHEGLNDAFAGTLADGRVNPCAITGVKSDRVYLDPDTCPTSTLSKVEYLAFIDQGGSTNDVSTWAKWSPERPTDPTLEDTDDDGFPDGYEYFFWYRAHVGYMENGRHKYMTGRRYDPTHPAETNVITSAEIAALFDPITAYGEASEAKTRDTDNDGLIDLLEFELGTNPVDCDTDGDGLPDGYEVMIGTDPLLWSTDKVTCDADLNPDGDWMANEKVEKQQVFGLDDGNGGVEYYTFGKKAPALGDHPVTKEFDVTYLQRLGKDGQADTNSFWVTTEEVKYRTVEVNGTNYCYLTKALTSKGTWKARMMKINPVDGERVVRGEPVDLPVGWMFNQEVTGFTAFDVFFSFPEAPGDEMRYWRVWRYGRDLTKDKDEKKRSNLVFGKEYNHASRQNLGKRAVRVMPFEKTVHRLHYHVYQDGGYDPRTAWKGKDAVKTTAFTHLDEFYTLAYFYNDGVLSAAELVPTRENPWTVLWEKYSTSPLSADTDEDALPDGWELYTMGGPKQYVEKADDPNYHERIVDYGPRWKYSPLISFNLLTDPNDRDNDKDKLEWPDEYMGVESGAQYPDCATIAAPYETWKARGWHNKKWPTDPWNEDTDGDGLTDGEEEAKVFIYGDPEATDTAGGGLNPLSWDTDGDFLPDPWELEFAGHYVTGASTNKTEVAVSEDKSTTNTVSTTLTAAGEWEGGMNGTVSDAFLDYDYDGLDNWQEYMSGAMRCWRYDDTISPWTNLTSPMMELMTILMGGTEEDWDDFWYRTLVDEQGPDYNPHFVDGTYDNGASCFSLCTNSWDHAKGYWFMFKDGVYHDLKNPPERYIVGEGDDKMIFNRFTWRVYEMFMQTGLPWTFWINGINNDFRVYPLNYICCDPTLPDTDLDGMDDYYELFHGLNPLLGQNRGDFGAPRPPQDVVYRAYGGDGMAVIPPIWSAQNNYWTEYGPMDTVHPTAHAKPRTKYGNGMDFEIYPWLTGLAHADPDGDNIPNQQEAILANVQAAASYLHTDPTPLWLTDSTYADSLPRRYFRDPLGGGWEVSGVPDGFKHVDPVTGVTNEYKFADFPLFSYDEEKQILSMDEYSLNEDMWDALDYFWSFEENEGYDSDHDYLSDFEEAQGKTKPASDPQNSDDPLRRQAMYFGGEKSPGLLQTPLTHAEQVPYADVASEARQNFLYYTAECWVKAEDVSPDKGLQTILERVIQCSSENPADENLTRRNFLLGVKNGRWYTKFDSTGTDANQPVEITDGPQATTNWTHLAATYDGTALRLYVDGVCNNRNDTSIQPEHGISALVVNDSAELISESGQGSVVYDNRTWPVISLLVGASAVGTRGVVIDYNPRIDGMAPPTTVDDYTGFFKGYVDEIRIWDGARPASDIRSDYQKRTRYNAALAAENRQVVYSNWRTGARRTPVSATQLPAQLMYHFTFDHLPGAVRAADVLRSPAGFVTAETVTDAKAIWSRPKGWVQPWWYGTLANLRSKVYAKSDKDCAWVPWIANTVAHLPRFDGTTLDSVYWSETYAGAKTAAEAGYPRFAFPRNHEVASKWTQMVYNTPGAPWSMHSHADFLMSIDGEDGELVNAYRFAMRDRKTEGDDLLPLLNAFPKRISAAEGGMWDEQGAADAWAQTGQDSNNDSLPDWWQAYARANYCKDIDPRQTLTWDTTVTYHGVQMPAWQAYLRDLAAGMLPGGKIDENYADTRDFDADGMPDWWEEQNKVQGYSQADADADPDNDGLSNYAEYLLGEVYPYAYGLPALDPEGYKQPKLDPQHAYSTVGQRVVDYFQSFSTNHVKVTTGAKTHFWLDEYFGEIATDHDFMEDWWENAFKNSYVSSKVYDPLDDADEDGWSNWAECRASLWGGYFNAALIDSWTGSDLNQYVVNYPVPVIGVRATYHGLQDVSGHQLVIRTTTGQTPRIDATFIIPPALDVQKRYIGPFLGDYMLHGHLSPGLVNVNDVVFGRAKNDMNKTFYWNWNWYVEYEHDRMNWEKMPRSGTFDEYRSWYARYPHIELEGGDLVWESFAIAVETLPGVADIMFIDGSKIGKLNSVTGEYELDLTKTGSDFGIYAFNVSYTSRVGHEWPQTVYVSDTKELAAERKEDLRGNGHVREGRNTIEVFLDLDGDGLYTEGEPFGSARNVMVGWHKVPEITIELKDESPIMPTVFVGGGSAGQPKADGSNYVSVATALTKTVKVIRESINEYPAVRTLLTKTIVVDDHPYVTELDVSTAAKPDLDWTWLLKDAAKIAAKHEEFAAVETATYRVDELETVDGVTVTNMLKRFVKEFPASRPTATALEPSGSAEVRAPVSSASPTLSFSISDTKATGYRLQIRKFGAASPIYDSGIGLLPGRGGATVGVAACDVTPPVYAGAPVYSGTTTNREVFADGTNYQWRVALYDAKFNSTTDDSDLSAEWSAWANFEMDVCNSNRYPRLATGYGAVAVAVRYYGPATNDLRGKIVVEAFENADFRGQPLAQVRIGDLGELRSLNEPGAGNAVLRGIRPGTVFLRAFIDQNDNGSRDKWESWGYANMVGQGFKAIYNPDPYEVTVSTADWIAGDKADRVIYIEDCDANKNEQPDCLEPELFPEDVSSDADETEPIDWWEWAEADPDDVDTGDVMAYREVTMKLVTLWDGADANVLKSYLLCDGQRTPGAGDAAANYAFMTAWEYGTLMACGVPVPAEALAGLKVYETPKDVKVALVHAQVREKYGFCADTAVPGGKTDTKPFTAQDKYFVLRYLEQTGRLGEPVPEGYKSFEDYVMNSGNVKLYEKYCLKPNVIDNDHDGIADGFELYVDSKPLDASDRESDWDEDGVPLWREFDLDPDTGLAHATDPRRKDTDGDGVTDGDFHDFLLWDAGGDKDGDGLSNYAEYLITRVFKAAKLDARNPKTDGYCVDYFRKMGELYVGEIFTDHDQVNDVWEGASPDAANRYVYDPSRDDDNDGWSNYAEAKAGTDPETEADVGIDGYVLAAYPVPCIETFLSYSGKSTVAGPVVVKAWSQKTNPEMFGAADAVWHLGGVLNGEGEDGKTQATGDDKKSAAGNTSQKYVGLKPDGVRTFNLGPGAIQHGTVRICYKDLSYCKVKLDQYGEIVESTIGDPDSATWYFMAQDREGVLYTVGGIFADEQVVGSVDYETGKVTVNFNAQYMTGPQLGDPNWAVETEGGAKGGDATGDAKTYDLLNLDQSYVLMTWSSCTTLGSFNRTLYLSDADSSASGVGYGHVREGLNTFMAFVDSSGDGEYTPGEPFGFVRDVDVGWDGAKLEISLSETSAITPRIDLWSDESDRVSTINEAMQASAVNDQLLKTWLTNEAMRVWYAGILSNRVALVAPPDDGERTRIRVVRYGIDDMFCYRAGVYGHGGGGYEQRAVLDTTFDPSGRDFLCEADFLGDGQFDLDWDYLQSEVVNTVAGKLTVSNMTYLVVIGDGPTSFRNSGDTNTTVNALATMVTRRFEVVQHLPVAENVEGVVYGARPTFRWSIPDEEPWAKAYGSSYTAFKLQILKEDGKTVVYDSGVRRAPAQDSNGAFTWTADAFVGDQISAAGQWKWRVAMYNAKFKPRESFERWSNVVPFATATGTQQETDDHNYSSVDVAVKYTGPAAVLSAAGKVRVQAFETADFSGTPVAQISLTDVNSVKDASNDRKNCTLVGLPFGTYYVRAYIDSNGNGVRDDWESWGAAKDAVVVKPNQPAPITGLYIEDADTDQDWLPDAWEMAKYGNLATKGADIDPEGRIVLKKTVYDGIVAGTANISRFLSGATLTFFQNIGNVSLALGLSDVTEKSIAEIRALVEKNIDPNSVKITSLVVDPGNGTNGKVILTVAAKATDSIAGYLLSPVYELPKSTDVTINIYRKENLATDQWTFVKAVSKTIETTMEARVEVPIAGVDFNSGFYKVEIVQ